MAIGKTTNYSLNKPDRGTRDWDQYANQNMDTIDTELKRQKDEDARIDGRVSNILASQVSGKDNEVIDLRLGADGVARPTAGALVREMHSQQIAASVQKAVLSKNLNVVSASQSSPALVTVYGRTLVNLLGKDGNCEDLSKWTTQNATKELDSTNKVYGSNGIKITSTVATGTVGINKSVSIVGGKYYIVVADVKNGTATNVKARISGTLGNNVVNTSGFGISYAKFTNATDVVTTVEINLSVTAIGQFAYVDGIRLYEVDATTYNQIGVSLSDADIENLFPYVDDVKHLTPALSKIGKNLNKPFTEWTLHANAVVNSPYDLTLNATAGSQNSTSPNYKVSPSQQHSVKFTGNGELIYAEFDKNGTVVTGNTILTSGQTFTTKSNGDYVYFQFRGSAAGTFNFKDFMFVVGDATNLPASFEPYNADYVYPLDNIKLASNMDRTVVDRLEQVDNQKWILFRRFGLLDLDSSLPWAFHADGTGYKMAKLTTYFPNLLLNSQTVVKQNGTILKRVNAGVGNTGGDEVTSAADGTLFISISDTDSGWLEAWTGTQVTADFIKAYFNGWKYTGDGTTHTWVSLVDGTASPTQTLAYVKDNKASNLTPYQLMYQLKTSTEQEVRVEGAIGLHQGLNQIETFSGFQMDKVTFNTGTRQGTTPKRAKRIIAVRKGGTTNVPFTTYTSGGSVQPQLRDAVDTTQEYTVLYELLDKFSETVNPNQIEITYEGSQKEVVDALVQGQADMSTQLSINAASIAALYKSVKALGGTF